MATGTRFPYEMEKAAIQRICNRQIASSNFVIESRIIRIILSLCREFKISYKYNAINLNSKKLLITKFVCALILNHSKVIQNSPLKVLLSEGNSCLFCSIPHFFTFKFSFTIFQQLKTIRSLLHLKTIITPKNYRYFYKSIGFIANFKIEITF